MSKSQYFGNVRIVRMAIVYARRPALQKTTIVENIKKKRLWKTYTAYIVDSRRIIGQGEQSL